jgi:hypothetical protein
MPDLFGKVIRLNQSQVAHHEVRRGTRKNMAFSVEKCLSVIKHYVKSESFRTAQPYYNCKSGCPTAGYVAASFMKRFCREEMCTYREVFDVLLL